MRRLGLPALLLHQPENLLYLTGFYTPGFFMYHAMVCAGRG